MSAEEAATVFRDITAGDNGVPQSEFGPAVEGYPARAGWDACTGLGSIDGAALLAQLRQPARAPAGA
jgi:kumamolisin